MQIRIHRTDGKTGRYSQSVATRARQLAERLNPATLFTSGPIVIGVLNPFSVLNPDAICWIEVETPLALPALRPPNIDSIRRLAGRDEYEAILATQWPRWRKFKKGTPGEMLEGLVEMSMRSGESLFLHVTGRVSGSNLADQFFGAPAIVAQFEPNGMLYINPKTLVRARVYHSKDRINAPTGLWMAEADDI